MKKKLKAWWMQRCINLCMRLMEKGRFDITIYHDSTEVWVHSLVPELSAGCNPRVLQETRGMSLYEWHKDGVRYRSWVRKESDESS